MSIGIGKHGAIPAQSLGRESPAKPLGSEPGRANDSSARSQAAGETVSLNELSRLRLLVAESAREGEPFDQARVDRLKAALENGDYAVDADRLARRLLQAEIETFGR